MYIYVLKRFFIFIAKHGEVVLVHIMLMAEPYYQ